MIKNLKFFTLFLVFGMLLFPSYNPVPVFRKEILDTYPKIEDIFKI